MALGRIESKLLGARIDSSTEGLRTQSAAYNGAMSLMIMAAAQLPNVGEAVQSLRTAKLLPSAAVMNKNFKKWREQGLPASARDAWVKAGQPEEMLDQLEVVLRSPEWPSKIPSVEVSLRQISDLLVRVVDKRASSRVLPRFDETGG